MYKPAGRCPGVNPCTLWRSGAPPLGSRMTIHNRKYRPAVAALCLLLVTPTAVLAQGKAQHELLLFPSIQGLDTQNESDPVVRDSDLHVGTSILYSYSGDHFRFLGEYLASTHETELERLKAGWGVANNAMFWFGRFHVPSRFWINEFHHGQYMQTSITRPSLEEWEDESGSTPSHITGLLYEFEQIRANDAAIEYAFSLGLAPRFADQKLVPYDLLDPHSGHGLSVNAKLAFKPKFFDAMSYGLLLSWNEINAELPALPAPTDLDRIEQLTAGFFVNWRWRDLRLVSSAIYYDQKLRYFGGTVHDNFALAYVQPEYEVTGDVTLFGRVDAGIGEDNSVYLRMLPAFASHRNMLGVRWDFADFQALTFEFADTSRQGAGDSHLHRKELRLQWSGAFP